MKFKSKVPRDVDPIELADRMKLSIFGKSLSRFRRLDLLRK